MTRWSGPRCDHGREFCLECHGNPQASTTTKQGTLFTCIGKGGKYEDLGVAIGAGTSKGDLVQVYRDTTTGQLFFREPEDFIDRMEVIK
jgi:hypothetical protein